jgi:hypothetical protein
VSIKALNRNSYCTKKLMNSLEENGKTGLTADSTAKKIKKIKKYEQYEEEW